MNTTARRRQILSMVAEGKTLSEIGAHFGLSRQRIHQITGNIGYDLGSTQQIVKEHRQEMLTMIAQGQTFAAIARHFGIHSPSRLGRYLGVKSHFGIPKHGTKTCYAYHRCRCPVCREAYRLIQHAYHLRRSTKQSQGDT